MKMTKLILPATQLTGSLGVQPFSFTGPKNMSMTNFWQKLM